MIRWMKSKDDEDEVAPGIWKKETFQIPREAIFISSFLLQACEANLLQHKWSITTCNLRAALTTFNVRESGDRFVHSA